MTWWASGKDRSFCATLRPAWSARRDPLIRNGHSLMLSTAVTSVLGFVFWIVGARLYSPSVVGRNAFALSALTFVGGIGQLNLANALMRFLPRAGRHRRPFVLASYAVGALVSIAFAMGFLLAVSSLEPSLSFLSSDRSLALCFVAGTAGWAIFTLEDGVLTGLRQARWVPVENAGFSLLKLALVVPLATLSPGAGILIAWVLATLVTVLPTNAFIVARALPRAEREAPAGRLPLGQLVRFVPYDYLAALAWLAATNLLSLLIIRQSGAAANGYFSVAWLITYVLYTVSISLGSSMVVESALRPEALRRQIRRVLGHLVRLLLPVVAVVVAAAPLLLRVFGGSYALHATATLRVLALSALPFVVSATAVSALRGQRRTRAVMLIDFTICLGVVGLSLAWLPGHGIFGVALAWLVTQVAVALVLVLGWRRWVPPAAEGAEVKTPVRHAVLRALAGTGLVRRMSALQGRFHDRRTRRACARIVPHLSGAVAELGAAPIDISGPTEVLPSASDVTVLLLSDGVGTPSAVLKVPHTALGEADLTRGYLVMTELSQNAGLGPWRSLLPTARLQAEGGATFEIELALAGQTAESHLRRRPERTYEICRLAVESIQEMHTATSAPARIDEAGFSLLFGDLLATLRRLPRRPATWRGASGALERLGDRLWEDFGGADLVLARVHGDYTPGNVLLDEEGQRVSGIVDWGQARAPGIPAIDALSFALAVYCRAQGRELGDLVCELLHRGDWPDHPAFLAAAPVLECVPVAPPALVLACWLEHVCGNLNKSRRYATNPFWWAANVSPVLAAVATSHSEGTPRMEEVRR